MSDARLRALERRFRSTGSVEDETEYLGERIRVGAIAPERVEIAAYLGHAASLACLGSEAPDVLTADDLPGYQIPLLQLKDSDLGYLAEVGAWWGQELCARFAIAATIHAIATQERVRPTTGGRAQVEVARTCLHAVERWVLDERFGSLVPELARPAVDIPCPEGENNLAWTCRGLVALSAPLRGPEGWPEKTMSYYLARTVLAATRISSGSRLNQARERTALLAVALDELVPWALGTGDPVRQRVTLRG